MFWRTKEVKGINHRSKVVKEVYYYARLAWLAITSCFGSGYWRGDKPWIGSDAWKD
jgi:hypothetical protein